jgi:hypothetical protein
LKLSEGDVATVTLRSAVPVIVLVSVLLTACGGCGDAGGPSVDAPSKPSRELSREPGLEAVGDRVAITESAVAELGAEIDSLERECVPAKGVSRDVVEARFGEGKAAVVSKVPTEAPADSAYRRYEFCADGVLGVRYDANWKVRWAHFENPYSTKGVPIGIGQASHPEILVHELRQRLAQMRRIREIYRLRFGE